MRLHHVLIALTFLHRPAIAQQSTCSPACSVRLSLEVTLGEADGVGAVTDLVTVARDAKGRYLVAGSDDRRSIVLFAPDGKPAGRYGRRGEGPGEFEFIWHIQPTSSGVRVFDSRLNRVSLFDDRFNLVATHLVPPFNYATATIDQNIIINSAIMSRALAGVPLHRVDKKGMVTASFGERKEAYRRHLPYAGHRLLAASYRGGVWATAVNRYQLERWSDAGEKLQEIIPDQNWFEPHVRGPGFTPDRPPPPLIRALRENRAGQLLVLIAVPDKDWKASLRPLRNHPDNLKYAPVTKNDYFDTRIEVFDVKSGRLIATRTMDDYAYAFADDERIASYHEDDTGVPKVKIWRVQLN